MDLTKQAYNLGRVYGLAAKALPKILGKATQIEAAVKAPMRGMTTAINTLHKNHRMTTSLDEQIANLLDDVSEDFPATATTDLQGAWWLGYYKAGETPKGIRANREARGWSQAQLAQRLGTTQKSVSRWETGEVMPSKDYLDLMAEVFGVDKVNLM